MNLYSLKGLKQQNRATLYSKKRDIKKALKGREQ